MSVLLLILKIIGIVLLVVLALLVLIIFALLFVPFAYRVKGSYHGKLDLAASIYGLCYLAGGGVVVSDSGMKSYLRILGIRKFLSNGNKPDKSGNTDQYDENMQDCEKTDDSNEQNPETKALDERDNVPDADVKPNDNNETETQNVGYAQDALDEGTAQEDTDETGGEKKRFRGMRVIKGKFRRCIHTVRSWITKVKEVWQTFVQAVRNSRQTMRRLQRLVQSERTKRAFTKLKASLWKLLHILMPRRLKLDLEFSTGSPDTTAQLLGILAMFPVGYQNRWNVHPDFTADNAYADAEFDVKGRILGFSLLKLILGLVLDKDCQKLYNYFRNMKA